MAFDLDGYLNDAKERQEQREVAAEERAAQEANQAAWDAKPWDFVSSAISTGTRVVNAYEELHAAQIASRDKYGVYIPTPEVQDASSNLLGAGVDFMLAPVRVVADHTTRPLRSYIGSKIEQSADEGSEFAQDVRGTETFVNYFMTDEDKLRKAREIEANTGISTDAFMDDDVAFKQALRINDYTNMKKNLMQGDFSMETVWQEFPELRDVAKMSPRDAALALHDIESVRQTHGIVETFTHFLAVGNKKCDALTRLFRFCKKHRFLLSNNLRHKVNFFPVN